MSKNSYNATVAAKTRAADQILRTPDLLAKFEDTGGLPRDLEGIRNAGQTAEAANLGQSLSMSDGKSATQDVLLSFAALQKEYKSVMGVVEAVRAEAERNGDSPELVTKLAGILVNEAEVTVTTVIEGEAEGEKKRKVRKSASQEALRAEIAKDAGALLALDEAKDRLAERRVTADRLLNLQQSAEALSGLLAERAAARGNRKTATQTEHDACALQRNIWGGTYRILAALGRQDERVRALLSEAAR